ncbi:MAG: hypothetical protein COB50_01545 [Thiotrichales bacterium]|nr:MAG: hypothetical protein COB50_01545 [Thiotrichales bacterium]
MRKLVWFCLILGIAVSVGLALVKYPSYVTLQVGHTFIASPLWLLLVVIVLLIVIFRVCGNFIHVVLGIPVGWRKYFSNRKQNKTHTLLKNALSSLLLEDWHKASGEFLQLSKMGFFTKEMYLLSMSCALSLDQDLPRSIKVLLSGKLRHIDHFLELKSLVKKQEWVVAEKFLHGWQDIPNVVAVYKVCINIFMQNGSFKSAAKFIEKLEKINAKDAKKYKTILYTESMRNAKNIETVQSHWSGLSRMWQSDSRIVIAYADALVRFRQGKNACEIMEKSLLNCFHEEVFLSYSSIDNAKLHAARLQFINSYLQNIDLENSHKNLLAMGNVYLANYKFIEAKQYFEKSLAIVKTKSVLLALAKIASLQGQQSLSSRLYEEASCH